MAKYKCEVKHHCGDKTRWAQRKEVSADSCIEAALGYAEAVADIDDENMTVRAQAQGTRGWFTCEVRKGWHVIGGAKWRAQNEELATWLEDRGK